MSSASSYHLSSATPLAEPVETRVVPRHAPCSCATASYVAFGIIDTDSETNDWREVEWHVDAAAWDVKPDEFMVTHWMEMLGSVAYYEASMLTSRAAYMYLSADCEKHLSRLITNASRAFTTSAGCEAPVAPAVALHVVVPLFVVTRCR